MWAVPEVQALPAPVTGLPEARSATRPAVTAARAEAVEPAPTADLQGAVAPMEAAVPMEVAVAPTAVEAAHQEAEARDDA